MPHRFSLPRFSESCAVLGLFSLMSVPSLKLLYSSELVNLVPPALLGFALLLRPHFELTPTRRSLAMAWLLFSVAGLMLFHLSPVASTQETAKFLYLIVAVFLVIAAARESTFRGAVVLLVAWGTFLAVWQLSLGVPLSRELGQHYLTVSMPIGAALAFSLVAIAVPGTSAGRRFGLIMMAVVQVGALATLLSRSALVYPALITAFFVFAVLVSPAAGKFSRKVGLLIIVFIALTVIAVYASSVEMRQIYRIVAMIQNLEAESRVALYLQSADYIAQRPLLGWGTGSTHALFTGYPHNIFLDVLVQGGVVLFASFLAIVGVFAFRCWNVFSRRPDSVMLCGGMAMSLFFFMQWNSSFELTGAYVPISAMVLAGLGVERFE